MSVVRRVLYTGLLFAGSFGIMQLMPVAATWSANRPEIVGSLMTVGLVAVMTVWMVFWMMCAVWDHTPGTIARGLSDMLASFFWRPTPNNRR